MALYFFGKKENLIGENNVNTSFTNQPVITATISKILAHFKYLSTKYDNQPQMGVLRMAELSQSHFFYIVEFLYICKTLEDDTKFDIFVCNF